MLSTRAARTVEPSAVGVRPFAIDRQGERFLGESRLEVEAPCSSASDSELLILFGPVAIDENLPVCRVFEVTSHATLGRRGSKRRSLDSGEHSATSGLTLKSASSADSPIRGGPAPTWPKRVGLEPGGSLL